LRPDVPHILLVNPWIHDFAAYDFWARPLGLLTLAAILRLHGLKTTVLDCLNRFHPKAPPADPEARSGRGPYLKTRIRTPEGLAHLRRRFCRYGIPPEWLQADLEALSPPDLILVTSLMTYWYPGVRETIEMIRRVFPEPPVVLGGIYASLCPDHAAAASGADRIVTGSGAHRILELTAGMTGFSATPRFDPGDLDTYPYPALETGRRIGYVPLLTSVGCPFSCAYCASRTLNPHRMARSPESVVEEIRFWRRRHGARNFVFYDDALLVHPQAHIMPILEGVLREGLDVRFHTPNAVHIRYMSDALAALMRRSGFETLRLGLETAHFSQDGRIDDKVSQDEFPRAAACLRRAGFPADQVGAYLLAGLPGQGIEGLAASIRAVQGVGITPILAYYTPIPGTALWDEAVAASPFDLAADPIYTNNAIMPCWPQGFSWKTLTYLKNLIRSG